MNMYGIDMFGLRVGYVYAEDKDRAVVKAANIFGFNDLNDYVCDYPGHYSKGSRINNLIRNAPTCGYVEDTVKAIEDVNFLLMSNDGNWCFFDLIQSAKEIGNNYHWYDRTLIVPNIDELKLSDRSYFDSCNLDNHMYVCLDWNEDNAQTQKT